MRIRDLVIPAVFLFGSTALAGRVVFDFEAPGQDQTGTYEISAEVVLAGGRALLAERSGWALPDWRWRIALQVDVPGQEVLQEHPVRLDLSLLPDEVFDRARLDGADLVVTDASGTLVPVRWVEWFDFIARRGSLWFRPAALNPGQTVFFLYFGNPDHDDPGSAEAVFSYSAPVESAVVASPVAAGSSLVLTSFLDANVVHLEPGGLDLNLDAQDLGTVASADQEPATVVSAPAPFFGAFEADGTDALVPLVASATAFVYPSPRYRDVLSVSAPFGDAQVTVFDGATQVASFSVPAGTTVDQAADVADMHAMRVESDVPVVVARRSVYNSVSYDAFVFLPPDLELVGASSGNSYVVALEDGTQVDVFDSNALHQSFVLDSGEIHAVSSPGGQGSGPAIHVMASGPVAGLSYADGDGGETITFLRRQDLGRTYVLPTRAQYVLVASPTPGTTCRIRDASGQVLAEERSDVLAPEYPNRLYFTNVPAGAALECDAPVFAMMEDAATDDERNLWPMKFHRQALDAPVDVSVRGAVESRYGATSGWVVTPVARPGDGVARFLSFHETGETPPGTELRYQLSVDEGRSWLFYDGEAWSRALTSRESNEARTVHQHIRELAVPGQSLVVRAYLESEDGTVTPVLDELVLDYAGPGEPVAFAFETIDGTQVAGRLFPVTIMAVDASGLVATSFEEPVELSTLHGQVFPGSSPPFQQGRLTLEVSVTEVGPVVRLVARRGAVLGLSEPFAVVAPEAGDLALEKLSGDEQVGTVGQVLDDPIVVRVTDQVTGRGAPGVSVSFQVLEGGGLVRGPSGEAASETEVVTDASGLAQVDWTLGPQPGANRLEVRLEGASGSPATFVARGDPPGTEPGTEEYWATGGGGCDCRTGSDVTPGPWILLLGLVTWRWRRRRRARGRRAGGGRAGGRRAHR